MATATKQIAPEIVSILRELEIEGNVVKACPRQLDRPIYIALNKVLEALGGKWNKSKKGHVFADRDPATEIAAAVGDSQYQDEKTAFQFFPTSPELAAKLVKTAGVKPGMSALEPSAGNGAIAQAVKAAGAVVDCIELNPRLVTELRTQGYNDVIEGDFLKIKRNPAYNVIVMNPPFNGGQDIAHVRKAWELLLPGGKLVSIMSPAMTFHTDKKHTAFREWAEEIGAEVTKNPAGSFKHAKTSVDTITFVATKE